MSVQHTPGPWELIQFGGNQIGNPKTGEAVCTMWGGDYTDPDTGEVDPWRANAGLIAAAPDLLASLRHIFAKLDRGDGAPGHSHTAPGIWDADNAPGVAGAACEWCAHWESARKALSDATGGQP